MVREPGSSRVRRQEHQRAVFPRRRPKGRNRGGLSTPFLLPVVLAILVAVAIGVATLRTSRLGSAMLAVRTNEKSAGAAGINVVRTKVAAFAIGAFISGLGGSMLAYQQGNVTFDQFDVVLGLTVFATAYLAGITSVSGAILAGVIGTGGIVYQMSDRWLSLGGWYGAITGAGFVLTVIKNPEGLVGPLHQKLADRYQQSVRTEESQRSSEPVDRISTTAPDASEPILTVTDLTVRYGGMTAVDEVGFEISAGTIVGLIGPNGAGKTTLLDALSGLTTSTGSVADQRTIDELKSFERARAGLGRTFQGLDLWDDLSVRENVEAGLSAQGGRTSEGRSGLVDGALDLLRLRDVADRPAGDLSEVAANWCPSPVPWSANPRSFSSTSRQGASTARRASGWRTASATSATPA